MFNVRSALLTNYRNVLNVLILRTGVLRVTPPTKGEESGYSSDGVSGLMRTGRDELVLYLKRA